MRIIFLLLSTTLGCMNLDDENVINNKTDKGLLWYNNLSDHGGLWNYGLIETGLLCVTQFNNEYGFVKLDSETGEIIYKTNCNLDENRFRVGYAHNNNLVLSNRISPFCVDINTGRIKWINESSGTVPHLREYITGNGDKFYTARIEGHSVISGLYEGDVNTGELNLVYYPELILPNDFDGFYLGGVDKVAYYKNSNGDNMLLIHMVYFGESDWGIDWIKTYNLDTRQFILDSIPVYHGQVSWPPVFEDDHVYLGMSKGTIAKMDLTTGDTLWQKRYDRYLNTHEMLIVDENLYFLTDGAYGLFHSVDKNTGKINWTTRTKAGSYMSIMYPYKNHIYFSSFNSAGIHAFNIHSGREVWYKKPPEEHGSNFLDTFYLLPGKNGEKGRIFTRTLTHMYCYETIN